jgi:hypothetical protein
MTSFEYQRKIHNHWQNFEAIDDDDFFSSVYDWLLSKRSWKTIEYNFLSWLNYTKNFRVPFNLPLIPRINTINETYFFEQYILSHRRQQLYQQLKKTVELIKERFHFSSVVLLIGGSFAEQTNSNPRDIDIILLVANNSPSELHENFLYGAKMIETGIDLKVLPADYSLLKFKAYSNIIHLGNKVKFKDTFTTNNEFISRTLLKITM